MNIDTSAPLFRDNPELIWIMVISQLLVCIGLIGLIWLMWRTFIWPDLKHRWQYRRRRMCRWCSSTQMVNSDHLCHKCRTWLDR